MSGFLLGAGLTAGAVLPVAAQTLTVEIVDYDTEAQALLKNKIIPQFEAAHPGVEVKTIVSSWDTLRQDITAWYAAGIEPDVLQVGGQYVGLLVPYGLVMPLDDYVKNWPDLADFPTPLLEDGTYQGRLYDIPNSIDQRTLIYRKDMFAKSGLDPEKAPANWDELVQFAQKLTIKGDSGVFKQMGFQAIPEEYRFAQLTMEAGGRFVSADLHHIQLTSPEAIQAAQFYSDLVNKYDVSPPTACDNCGVQESTAMDFSGVWELQTSDPNIEIGVALPPMGPASRAGNVTIQKWMIGSQSKQPQLAWDWIAFLSKPDNLAALTSLTNWELPARASMIRYEPWAGDPRYRYFFEATALTPPFRAQVPVSYDWIHGGGPLRTALEQILNNRQSPSIALAAAQQQEQAKLDAFWADMAKRQGAAAK